MREGTVTSEPGPARISVTHLSERRSRSLRLGQAARKASYSALVCALFWAAVINGVVAPPVLLLIVLLGADAAVMKRYVSGKLSLSLTGITTVFMAVAAITMFVTMFAGR